MTHAIALGAQVAEVVIACLGRQRDALCDLDATRLQPFDLALLADSQTVLAAARADRFVARG